MKFNHRTLHGAMTDSIYSGPAEGFPIDTEKARNEIAADLIPMIRKLTGSVQDCTKRIMSGKPYRQASKDEDNAAKMIAHYLGRTEDWENLLDN